MLSKELLDDSIGYKLMGSLDKEPVSLTDDRVSMGVVCIQWLTKPSQCFVVLDRLAWCEKMT